MQGQAVLPGKAKTANSKATLMRDAKEETTFPKSGEYCESERPLIFISKAYDWKSE